MPRSVNLATHEESISQIVFCPLRVADTAGMNAVENLR
jgi:hypothetical protein